MATIKELIEQLEIRVAQSEKEKQASRDKKDIYDSAFASGEIHTLKYCIHNLK